MQRFKLIIAIVVLITSTFLLFNYLFSPMPIQITIDGGTEVTTQSPQYFSLSEVMLLVVCAFLIGGTATYLYFESDIKTKVAGMMSWNNDVSPILKLLKPDERRVMIVLQKSNGEMQQNRLVEKLGLSKVKITRVLARLEHKGLVMRTRSGLTNKVKIV